MYHSGEGVLAPSDFLSKAGPGRRIFVASPHSTFFQQGEPADSIFYLQHGRARLSVVSGNGRQATVGLLVAGDFLGEESLNRTAECRAATAFAITECSLLQIRRKRMIQALQEEHALSERFREFLLTRVGRVQADLVDHIFNCSEKRLVRVLLLLANGDGTDDNPAPLPRITQEELASMVGTTRSRISFFMNRFRKKGLIAYADRIYIHKARLNLLLQD